MRSDGGDRLAADDREAGDDDRRPGRAARRQLLPEHQGCEQEPAERRAGGLDHAAMAERHQQEARIAQDREQRPAEQRQRSALAPADAAEIGKSVAGDERQEDQTGPDEAMKGEVRRRKPDRDAVAAAAKPAAQNRAAPAPQHTPTMIGGAIAVQIGGGASRSCLGRRR